MCLLPDEKYRSGTLGMPADGIGIVGRRPSRQSVKTLIQVGGSMRPFGNRNPPFIEFSRNFLPYCEEILSHLLIEI